MSRKAKANKSKSPWLEGIWAGKLESTDEHVIMTDTETLFCRTVRRLPRERQWQAARVLRARGTP